MSGPVSGTAAGAASAAAQAGFPSAGDLLAALPKVRGRLSANVPLAPITWFRVGGPAEVLFAPADADDLAMLLAAAPAEVLVTVIGVGSNLLVRDGGVPGVVIRLGRGFGEAARLPGDRLEAGAGVPDKKLAAVALREGLGGLAFYHGIPGSVGGALRMNAGANGVETAERVVEVRAVARSGQRVVLTGAEMGFAYRASAASADLVFTHAVFQGIPAPAEEIRAAMDQVQDHREAAQPIREKTGGSTFKNPPGHSAWRLVEAAGCRGLVVGGAKVSEMHCNFLINFAGASAADLERLGETVRERVAEASGVTLEWEIKRIGIPAS